MSNSVGLQDNVFQNGDEVLMVKMQRIGHVVGKVTNPVVEKNEEKSELYFVKTVEKNVFVVSKKDLILVSKWIRDQFLGNAGAEKSLFWKKMNVKYDEKLSKDSFYYFFIKNKSSRPHFKE